MALTRIRAQQISDIDYKQAVRVIALSNITLSGGAPNTVDGVNLAAGDRILVAGQDTGSQNGLYDVITLGTGSNGTWGRTADGDVTGEIQAGMIIMVTEGDTYKDTQWKLTTNNPIVIGTTPLVFEQNSAFTFGNIYANGTAVLASTVGGSVIFSPGDNISILGNNTTKTVTISAAVNAASTEISSGTSNVKIASSGGDATVGIAGTNNVVVFGSSAATFAGNVLPAANITYDLGASNQRWNDLWLANSTIYIGSAQISANSTALVLTNPGGGATVLAGASSDIQAATVSATGNITGGNVLTEGLVSAGGNITGGNIITAGTVKGATIDSVNADLAERYLPDQQYPAGTVVIFGGAKEITQSTRYADSRIAGVISTAPAYCMNVDAPGQPVALQGRVPCRVVGSIQKGDLITSSDQPGVATGLAKGDWVPGCVIGKALANYDSDEVGEIEVVVGRL